MIYKQFNSVRLLAIHKQISKADLSLGNILPKIGDVACIVEVYEKPSLGYELECVNKNGITNWMLTFSTNEVDLELLNENT